jgi:hypothetical protein
MKLKTELIDGINCARCNDQNKIAKLSKDNSKVVTKRKACKCNKCNKLIKVGEKAFSQRIELLNGNDYSIYYHIECVEITE